MLVLSKFENFRNISVNMRPESQKPQDVASGLVLLSLEPGTLNALTAAEETAFVVASQNDPTVKEWIRSGMLKVIVVGNGNAGSAEVDEAEKEAAQAQADVDGLEAEIKAAKPAAKAALEKKLAAAQTKAAKTQEKAEGLRKGAKAPGAGDYLPDSLAKVDDAMAIDMVEGIVDLGVLRAYLRGERRQGVVDAVKGQIDRVNQMLGKAKDLAEV